MNRCVWARCAVLALACAGCRPPHAVSPVASELGLRGAWRVVEEWIGRPGEVGTTISALQASLYIFASRHYSIMYVPGSEPRRPFPQPGPPTDAERLAAYDRFVANSGTYQADGSRIVFRRIVAKVPNVMGTIDTLPYSIRGDTLWLTVGSGAPAQARVVRLKLLRLE